MVRVVEKTEEGQDGVDDPVGQDEVAVFNRKAPNGSV